MDEALSRLRTAVDRQTQRLRKEKDVLLSVLDGMLDPAYLCSADYRIYFANKAMEEIVGDISNQNCYEAIFQRQQPCDECPLNEVLSGKIVRQERYLEKTGQTYDLIHSPFPLKENPTHKLGVCRDISERIESRRRLQQINQELEAFVSAVSHDLRSPLTPLIGYAELLKERYAAQLDPLGQECIDEIIATAGKMHALLEDLLSLSRIGQAERPAQAVDATRVAHEVHAELLSKLQPGQLQLSIAALPEIFLPESLLADLFRNLICNASNYAVAKDPRIELRGEETELFVRYRLIDHGPGVPESEREQIFQPFRRGQASDDCPGSGIGLATVARICRSYNGRIWVEETPGGGATFVLEFLRSDKK